MKAGLREIINAVEADATPLEDTFLSCADNAELLKLAYPLRTELYPVCRARAQTSSIACS
jgi:hypothetical protein